ncbi:MAG: SDR family NAD(P)-dependent oxidoreductase [Candidatus Wallbacteria bacterium]|nr:SDR family NAD(P)-dependent oxidoreductase [Candidatus Wallbacteria bacterium]
MRLFNRNAVITGASQGFGLAVAREFIQEGASVVICGRDLSKLKQAAKELSAIAGPDQKVIAVQADVSLELDVKKIVEKSLKELGRIDILVNNAGVYGPKGLLEEIDTGEWVKAIEINLLGVFFTCKHFLPHLKNNNSGKIINLSGGGATNPLPRISAYAASKAAVVRLTETLAEEYRDFGIDINAVAPGALNTRLLEEVLEAGPQAVGEPFYKKALKQKETGGIPLEKGASLCAYLASAESNGITGKLISAVWDPWETLQEHAADLQRTDVYTLRRIVPTDRNLKWS